MVCREESGEKELAVAEAEKRPASPSRRCRPETRRIASRELIFLGERSRALLKESRETTKERARAGLYTCAPTLRLTLQTTTTTTERPEFSLVGLTEFGARAHPASSLHPPTLRLCERDHHRAYGGVSRAATAFPSPRVIDLALSPTARENKREFLCERDPFSTEKGDRQRVVVFTLLAAAFSKLS